MGTLPALTTTRVVIPCYNEARRLSRDPLRRLLVDPRVSLLLVDDGSTDETGALLRSVAEELGPRVAVLSLGENQGKAEAVRRGLRRALELGDDLVGYLDADMATPPEEALRLITILAAGDVDAVVGSRVAHMGARIERRALRHHLGRVFATAASLALAETIYDSQCGAKFFRSTTALTRAVAEPFCSRWAFDVELLGRLLMAGGTAVEVPLMRWVDVAGSRLTLKAMLRAGLDLARIASVLRDPEYRARFAPSVDLRRRTVPVPGIPVGHHVAQARAGASEILDRHGVEAVAH